MKKRRRADILLILCGVLVWFLSDAAKIRAATAQGLALCASAVIPALFPFLVICDLLISLGFGQWLSPYLAGLMGPLFHLPGTASSALLLGLVGGYPIGARTAANLCRERLLTTEEAARLLAFCNNANPVFFITVLGAGVFGSTRVGVWLWLIHLLSALLTGLLLCRGAAPSRSRPPAGKPAAIPSFSMAFVDAVRNSAGSMLTICGFVTLFYVLTRPMAALGGVAAPLLTGIVELFSLTPLLVPDRLGLVLAAAMSGFGGLSVLCQTAAVLEGSGLRLKSCFVGKALQGLLSALLATLLSGYILT